MKTLEPNEQKSSELQSILFEIIKKGDMTPIKMIESISGNRKRKQFLFNFIPYSFEPEYQFTNENVPIAVFEGSADSASYKIDLGSNEKESALLKGNPIDCQVTLFITRVISFEL